MIITNIETVPGKSIIEHFGLVSGSTIRAKHIGRDFMAGLKNIVGGELKLKHFNAITAMWETAPLFLSKYRKTQTLVVSATILKTLNGTQ